GVHSSCAGQQHDQVDKAVGGAKRQRAIRVNPLDHYAGLAAQQSQGLDPVSRVESHAYWLPLVRDCKLRPACRAVLTLADEPQRTGIKVKLYALVGFAQDNSTLAHCRQERSCVKLGAAWDRLEKDRLVVRKHSLN